MKALWHKDDPRKFDDWLRDISRQSGAKNPLGTIQYVDAGAVLRGLAAVEAGKAVSIARSTQALGEAAESRFVDFDSVAVGYDTASISCHGFETTHLDGLNHIGWDGTWWGGSQTEAGRALQRWSQIGISTRGVYIDVPRIRGTRFVGKEEPIQASEIESILGAWDIEFLPGDALLLDGGRDMLEQSGEEVRAAVAPSVARWLVERKASIICWDLMDAPVEPRNLLSVHRLIWAVGLAIVDNCDFSRLRDCCPNEVALTHISVSPWSLPQATGCVVNPIVLI